jgi:hypothetical protein
MELRYHDTLAIFNECEDSTLPASIEIAPSIINYKYRENLNITVNLSNFTIQPKSILCEFQPVTIDHDSIS